MITGIVNDNREALIRLYVYGANGIIHEVEAAADTGFNGYLTLPTELISALALVYSTSYDVMLANGSMVETLAYKAEVEWGGERRSIEVEAEPGRPLVGLALMEDWELTIQIKKDGTVVLRKM